jgi:putative oxidoreductase
MTQTDRARWGTTVLRVITGIVFIAHGAMKLFGFGLAGTAGFFAQAGIPFAGVLAPLVIAIEISGGLLLIAGLFTRWASLPLAATMIGAIASVHLKAGFFLPDGYEFALVMLASTVVLALQGSGALALDNVRHPADVNRALRQVA